MQQILEHNEPEGSAQELCVHCHEPVVTPFKDSNSNTFCCSGCMHVHAIINEYELNHFYKIQKETQKYTKSLKDQKVGKFSFLDNLSTHDHYVACQENHLEVRFYLEGIHCVACLWLIEKVADISDDIISSVLNVEKSIVYLHLKKDAQLSDVASLFNQLGYYPHIIESDDDALSQKTKEERGKLIRIGVALACSMNVMLYSLGVYAGASSRYQTLFNILSLILSIPVVTYCAYPFYKTAFLDLKKIRINLDVPLSFSILVGFSLSTYNVINNYEEHYFDSITVLVLLILLSRYILSKTQQHGLKVTHLASLFNDGSVTKINDGQKVEIESSAIKKGDILYLKNGDRVPCDGIIHSGECKGNTSLLTGESRLESFSSGHKVLAGTVILESDVEIKCLEEVSNSKITKVIQQATQNLKKKPAIVELTHHISQYFIGITLFLFLIVLTYFGLQGHLETGLQRALALVIIACPCALGLATPLAYARSMKKASELGLIIKDEKTLEEVAKTENIYLDKTGTLTYGHFIVNELEVIRKPSINYSVHDILFSLEKDQKHPIAKSIIRFLASSLNQTPLKEIPWEHLNKNSRGVQGLIQGKTFIIKPTEENSFDLELGLFEDDIKVARLKLTDELRPEIPTMINWLKQQSYKLHILSGDSQKRVDLVTHNLADYFTLAKGRLLPQDKGDLIEHASHTMMIGDGANDSLAFSKANISVAMNGAIESSLKIADVYLTNQGLAPIKRLLILARETKRVVYRNLMISAFYNIAGAVLALLGFIGPLEAAVIMPLSSLTVVALTVISTTEMNELHKMKEEF